MGKPLTAFIRLAASWSGSGEMFFPGNVGRPQAFVDKPKQFHFRSITTIRPSDSKLPPVAVFAVVSGFAGST